MFKAYCLPFLMFIAAVVLTASCTIPVKTVVRGPLHAADVPSDFSPEQDILLVAAMPSLEDQYLIDEKSTRKLDEALQKYYPYRYRIVSLEEIYDPHGKYSRTTVFRFALMIERKVIKQAGSFRAGPDEGLAFTPGYKSTLIDFAFYDRLKEQRFPHSGNSASVMRIAVSNLTMWINKAKRQMATDVAKLSGEIR
jgi:hypothetical protein